jgi:catechol 2,3-dioxygenase-like lactoylglutathione lyase family enzyme
LSHLQLNVSDQNASRDFYLRVLSPLGFQIADEQPGEYARLTNGSSFVLVLCRTETRFSHGSYHRKATGLGHFAIQVSSPGLVDAMEQHLAKLGIPLLGEGKVETGYRRGYYCLAFEDPDRVMVEIVCHDPYYFSPAADPCWSG